LLLPSGEIKVDIYKRTYLLTNLLTYLLRVMCVRVQHLQVSGAFQSAARELLEWCSDTRAFQWQFENNLLACLTVLTLSDVVILVIKYKKTY